MIVRKTRLLIATVFIGLISSLTVIGEQISQTSPKLEESKCLDAVSPPAETKTKTEICPGTTTLPVGCVILSGSERSARWLQCWREKSGDFCNLGEILFVHGQCPLSAEIITQIVSLCQGLPSHLKTAQCVQKNLRYVMQRPEYVCRHFADCLENILDTLGTPSDLEGGFLTCGESGHAWVENHLKTIVIVSDPSNGIQYYCPK